jgi:uncharacterized protein YjbI with pentapeptide repeats
LYETGLIIKDRSVIDLLGADLRAADLRGVNLSGADLRNVKELSVGQLDRAYSLEGTTMPDGSKHP